MILRSALLLLFVLGCSDGHEPTRSAVEGEPCRPEEYRVSDGHIVRNVTVTIAAANADVPQETRHVQFRARAGRQFENTEKAPGRFEVIAILPMARTLKCRNGTLRAEQWSDERVSISVTGCAPIEIDLKGVPDQGEITVQCSPEAPAGAAAS